MCKFSKLFELMTQKGITQKQLSDAIGVSTGNISDWKSGRSSPSSDKIILLATYFEVTSDYLLGLSDTPQNEISTAPKLTRIEQRMLNAFQKLPMEEQLIEIGRIEKVSEISEKGA